MQHDQLQRIDLQGIAELAKEIIRKTSSLPNDQRFLLGIVGVPGAGKTTFAQGFTVLLNELSTRRIAVAVPMDGFHLSNEKLEEIGLLALKGIPATFDASAFVSLIKEIKTTGGKSIWCPSFDRTIESTVPNSIEVASSDRIAVVEGNYLLLEDEPWKELSEIFSETWFIDEEMDQVEERLVERHMSGGKTSAEARQKVESTDLPNARLILETAKRASKILRIAKMDH